MLEWLNSFFSIKALIWMFPITFMLHDFEEIIFIEPWLKSNQRKIFDSIPYFLKPMMKKFSGITSYQFALTVAIEFVMLVPFTFIASEYGNYYYFVGFNAIAFLHVFTHLGQSLVIKRYTPGVATAILITLPYSLYVFYRLLAEQITNWSIIFASIPFGMLVIPAVLIGHNISIRVLSGAEYEEVI